MNAPTLSAVMVMGDANNVLLAERSLANPVMGGYAAFPGGKCCSADDQAIILNSSQVYDPKLLAAAVREFFEETGILLGGQRTTDLPALRQELLANNTKNWRPTIDAQHFRYLGHRTTPAFATRRFETHFFQHPQWASTPPLLIPGELDGFIEASASALLKRWEKGELLMVPPVQEVLRNFDLPAYQPSFLEEIAPIAPGLIMIPVPSNALAPATHTNLLVIGKNPAWIVDPGANSAEGQAHVYEVLSWLAEHRGYRYQGIFCSHSHLDHWEGVPHLQQRMHGLPVLAHSRAASRIKIETEIHKIDEQGHLGDWQILLLEGHDDGHCCLWNQGTRTLVVFDLVSPLGTMVLTGSGDLVAKYCQSLEAAINLNPKLLIPSHGPPVAGASLLSKTLEHRHLRERQTIAFAQGRDGFSLQELVDHLYPDLKPEWRWLGEKNSQAHLTKLINDNVISPLPGDRYALS